MIEVSKRVKEKEKKMSDLGLSILQQQQEEEQPEEAMLRAVNRHNKNRSLWIKRKQCCMDVVDMLSESLAKKNSVIMVFLFSNIYVVPFKLP
jgi:hypothetical protein